MVFDRRVNDQVLTFSVSGLLRDSNLIMWDVETESWWQQGTLQAIVGEHAGRTLTPISSSTISWSQFRDIYPTATVLGRLTDLPIYYGTTPYENYDTTAPSLFEGKIVDDRLPVLERVVGLNVADTAIAYPFTALSQEPVLYQTIDGKEFVFFFDQSTISVLDQRVIQESRPVGSVGAFLPVVDGQRLTFRKEGQSFIDEETGSTWNIVGRAVAGELEGKSLAKVFHTQPFWFYWQSAHPDTEVYEP